MDTLPNPETAGRGNRLRAWVPLLGVLAMLAVALKLPNMMTLIFGQAICPVCNQPYPFVTALAGAYFVLLTVVAVCFPRFPGQIGAYIGFLWALFLASYMMGGGGRLLIAPKDGQFCPPCAVAHGLHILMWLAWWLLPPVKKTVQTDGLPKTTIRLCLAGIAWLGGLAAFGTMNRMMLELPMAQYYTPPRLPSPQTMGNRPVFGPFPTTMPVTTRPVKK
jgi:hypothetical protein